VISPADLAATTAGHDPHQLTASPPTPETGPTVTGQALTDDRTGRQGKESRNAQHATGPDREQRESAAVLRPQRAEPGPDVELLAGGKDNFAADREAGERVLQVMPSMPLIARAAPLFLIDAVHQLATEYGVRQFLDIGTGLPTADNTHHVAQRAASESRIGYADHDPVVLSHAQALLTSSPTC
jgi:hypothetical protein